MLRGVVTDGSGAQLADLPGPPVIAKTGTAEYVAAAAPCRPTPGWSRPRATSRSRCSSRSGSPARAPPARSSRSSCGQPADGGLVTVAGDPSTSGGAVSADRGSSGATARGGGETPTALYRRPRQLRARQRVAPRRSRTVRRPRAELARPGRRAPSATRSGRKYAGPSPHGVSAGARSSRRCSLRNDSLHDSWPTAVRGKFPGEEFRLGPQRLLGEVSVAVPQWPHEQRTAAHATAVSSSSGASGARPRGVAAST